MTNVSDIAKQLGKLGGQKTKQKYGTEHYRIIAKKGLKTRWMKVACPVCEYTDYLQRVIEHQKALNLDTA